MDTFLLDPIFTSQYTYESDLGQGSFGKVCKCLNKLTKSQVAVKIIPKSGFSKSQGLSQVLSESHILGTLNHPNIVKLNSVKESPQHLMLELELLEGGTLESRLSSSSFTDEEASLIMREMMKAVDYLHRNNIIHRDIKPENIMFSTNCLETVKLTDFGLSSQCRLDKGTDDSCGTALFMAPEQAVKRVYNQPVDIWSCGIVMYMLIARKHPLYIKSDTIESYFAKLNKIDWKFPSNFPGLAKDLFLRMTRKDPLERYSADMVLRHPWITREVTAKPPMTYLERLNSFNLSLKARKIFVVSLILASLRMSAGADSQDEMPKIIMKFDISQNKYHRRHTSIEIKYNKASPVKTRRSRPISMVRS